jgi:hypothetical protein
LTIAIEGREQTKEVTSGALPHRDDEEVLSRLFEILKGRIGADKVKSAMSTLTFDATAASSSAHPSTAS